MKNPMRDIQSQNEPAQRPPAIDRTSYEPGYSQIARYFQDQIASGLLRPGDRLPSESQIRKLFNVSPMTVRRAINILVEQGIVITERGRGTFVKSMQFWSAAFELDQLKDIFSQNGQARIKVLEASIRSADKSLEEKMGISEGRRVLYIRRLVSLGDKPFMYHREFLVYDPTLPIIESELDMTSLQGLFEGKSNSYIKHGLLSIETTTLNPEEAQILGLPQSTAAFCLEHLMFDYHDKPVSMGWFICPGTNLKFTTVVGLRYGE